MAKEVFGEFSAYTTPGGVRFMRAGKLTSENAVPPEVVNYLRQKLGDDSSKVQPAPAPQPEPTFAKPTPEELAKMREDSLKVAPGLEMSPDEVAARSVPSDFNPNEVPLSPDDFDADDPEAVETRTELTQTQTVAAAQLAPALDSGGHAPLPRAVEPVRPVVDPDFMDSVSIHTADLRDIAQALYERFGIYTVYLGTMPQMDEVNPLTGVAFTKYHLGVAYQAAIYAANQGILERSPEREAARMNEGRTASANVQDQFDPVAHTLGESRKANNFNYRTSPMGTQTKSATRIEHLMGEDGLLHAVQVPVPPSELGDENLNGAGQRYDSDEEDRILEPPIFGTKPIIRPNW